MTEHNQTEGEHCDVLVIGGGPAGSTAAALLAERGRDVVLLEKDAHPRFHIGESLLPRNNPLFDQLGIGDDVRAMGVIKPGAEIFSDATGRAIDISFANGIDQDCTFAYQVRRSDFDAALFANAVRRGARAFEQVRVADVEFPAGPDRRANVAARRGDGSTRRFAPRFVLDATGRDTFLASRMRIRDANKNNNTAAVYAHFHGVCLRGDVMAGCISLHLSEDGWFWVIPLPDNVTSVGFVGTQAAFRQRRGTPRDLLLERIEASPTLSPRMRDATLASEVMTAGNYSYRARTCWGEGYMMIGDAFAFVDPVFSTGVLLAMTSASLGADVVDTWLDNPARGRVKARQAERHLVRGMDRLGWLIYRINDPVMRHMLMNQSARFRMREGLISLLAGRLDSVPAMRMPVLVFKATFHMLSLARRFGYDLDEGAPQLAA